MIAYILMTLYIIACLVLILFVLLQPGKSDAAAVFGGGVNSAAFGPRGTQTVLAKVTIGAAIVFFLIAFLFSIPRLFDKRSLGESVGPAQSQPATPELPPVGTPAPAATDQAPAPAASPAPTVNQPTSKQAKPAEQSGAKQTDKSKPESKKP